MQELLRILEASQLWIYLLIGLVSLYHIRKFFLALRQWRGTVFGLEKEVAQRKLSRSVSVLVILFALGAAIFTLSTFVLPVMPDLQILATPTFSLQEEQPVPGEPGTGPGSDAGVATSTPVPGVTGGCIEGQIAFTFPKNGDEISGAVELMGVVAVQNFGFYKYEYAPQGSTSWLTIAGNEVIPDGSLGFWDTSQLVPGDYRLRLVVTDNQGQVLPYCEVVVRVIKP
jgi:hypothetical protein